MDETTRHALGAFLMLFGTLWLLFVITPLIIRRLQWAQHIVDTEFAEDLAKLNIEPRSRAGKWLMSKLKPIGHSRSHVVSEPNEVKAE